MTWAASMAEPSVVFVTSPRNTILPKQRCSPPSPLWPPAPAVSPDSTSAHVRSLEQRFLSGSHSSPFLMRHVGSPSPLAPPAPPAPTELAGLTHSAASLQPPFLILSL